MKSELEKLQKPPSPQSSPWPGRGGREAPGEGRLLMIPPRGMLPISVPVFFFSSRRRHTRLTCDWSSDVCSSDLRLGWLCWASLVLLIVAGAAWFAGVASEISGKPLGATLSQGVWAVVLIRTRFGEDWLLRLALCVLLALCLAGRPFPRLRVSRVATWAGFLLGALVLATLAWAGHGAADPGASGNAHLVADILHLLAAGVWLGALVPLSLLLAETRSAGDRRSILVARGATARFSAMAVASVGTLVISGVVNTWFLAGTVPALVGTEYGRLLLLKLGLFAAMLLIA